MFLTRLSFDIETLIAFMGTDHITQVLLKEEGVHVPPPETQNKNERSSFFGSQYCINFLS